MYSDKDQDKLRIEMFCTNKFRNKIDGDHLQTLPIPYFLKSTGNMKLANGIGNSWCNLACYKLLSTDPNVEFTFIHIPKIFDVGTVVVELEKLIVSLLGKIKDLFWEFIFAKDVLL